MNILLAIFCFQMASDGWTTAQTLRFGGYEQSPWLAWLMLKIGKIPALLIVKLAPIAVVLYLYRYGFNGTALDWQTMAGLEVLYTYVIYRNWLALQRQKGH